VLLVAYNFICEKIDMKTDVKKQRVLIEYTLPIYILLYILQKKGPISNL